MDCMRSIDVTKLLNPCTDPLSFDFSDHRRHMEDNFLKLGEYYFVILSLITACLLTGTLIRQIADRFVG